MLLIFVTLLAVLAPWIAPVDPNTLTVDILQGPSAAHWLGTDTTGRDVFSRVVWGGRVSLLVGVTATLLGTGTGAVIAVATSYWGGKVDIIAQRFMDILWAFPSLIVAMVLMFVIGTSTRNVIFAISIVVVPSAARVVRSQVLSVKEMEYTTAARGYRRGRLAHHAPPHNAQLHGSVHHSGQHHPRRSYYDRGISELPRNGHPHRRRHGDETSSAQPASTRSWPRGMAIAPGVALSLAVYGFTSWETPFGTFWIHGCAALRRGILAAGFRRASECTIHPKGANMQRRLTITIDEDVYDGLYRVAGRRKISKFIESLVRPYVLDSDLDVDTARWPMTPSEKLKLWSG